MSGPIAIWDWEREPPPPSARAVVCRSGLYSTPVGIETADPRTQMNVFVAHGGAVVLPFEAHLMPSFKMRRGIIPALYAERQADLGGVGALLAVNAERRALVLCPREALDVKDALAIPHPRMIEEDPHAAFLLHEGMRDGTADGPRAIDLVVIIPPPEARTCGVCMSERRVMEPQSMVGPSGSSRPCPECNGSGRIEPWPMHTDWVRGIVEQCRAAGVPVVFLGWGEWFPRSHMSTYEALAVHRFEVRSESGERFIRVGPERAGRTLDDEEVMDLPEWLT